MAWPRRGAILAVVVDDDGLLDAQGAADRAGCSRTTIWRADPDELPYEKVGGGSERGGNRRYRPEDVDRYRDGRRRSVKGRLSIVETRLDLLERRINDHEEGHSDE